MNLKVKRLHPDAKLPTRNNGNGLDLYALVKHTLYENGKPAYIDTGIAVEIPTGYVGIIKERSGWAKDFGLHVLAGVIDDQFRGALVVLARGWNCVVKPGDRIAQLLILPCPAFEVVEVEELTPTARGAGGFGSTGR